MSTLEAKQFAVRHYFGALLSEMKRLSDMKDSETALSQTTLQVREFLEVR
jgi:hypothetical protein